MSKSRKSAVQRPFPLAAATAVTLECLEERRLLAWGPQATLIGQDLAAARGLFGAGTSIAILDTGIDYMHPQLGGGFGPGHKVIAGFDFVDRDNDLTKPGADGPMDVHGHGTAVAGMAAGLTYTSGQNQFQGIARDANLIALRTDTAAGLSWSVQKGLVEEALQWVLAHRTQYNIVAVNMSFGYAASRMADSPFADELQALSDAGVFLVAAAGNSGRQTVDYPAVDPNVWAVGGVNPNGTLWSSSSRGPDVDLFAPAVDLTVLWYYPGQANPHGYIVNAAAGTSFASPQAAGLAAVLRQIDPALEPAEILSIMQDTGDTAGDGTRRINVNKAIAEAYRRRDDAWEDNDGSGSAKALAFDAAGNASVSGLKLLVGDADWYRFTLGKQSDVDWALSLGGGGGTAPAVDLVDANGNVIKRLATADRARLGAGTYFIRFNAPAQTLPGTYGIGLAATPVPTEPPPPPPPPPATPGANGSSNGAAYDAAGRLHLAYYDEAARNLKYAVRGTDGTWGAVTVVDGGQYAGQFVSLALDSRGYASIAYFDAYNADLKYARFNGSSWDVQTVDALKTTGYYPSLQLGATGAAVISYYSKTAGDLRLAAWTGGGWAISTVDAGGDVGRYSSLAYNPLSGRWAVAYEDTTHGTFRYAEQGKSGWAATTVDGSTKVGGGYVSLAFSPKTKLPAMTYYDAYNADLKYASFNGSRWSTQAVASKGTVGLYSTLRIDAGTGLADVLYYNKGADIVLRASQGSGGVWAFSQVTTDGGRWISRAVGADGSETLAYVSGSGVAVVDL